MILALLALLSAAATPAPPAAEVTVLLLRHAEAASEPADDPGPSAAGLARIECLKAELADEKITHAFTSPFRRARETAGALAAAHGLQAQTRDPMAAATLADELAKLPSGSTAIVVGHSNTLPLLVKAFGGDLEGLVEERGQPALPRDQFDRLIRIRLKAGDVPATERLLSLRDGRQAPCAAR